MAMPSAISGWTIIEVANIHVKLPETTERINPMRCIYDAVA